MSNFWSSLSRLIWLSPHRLGLRWISHRFIVLRRLVLRRDQSRVWNSVARHLAMDILYILYILYILLLKRLKYCRLAMFTNNWLLSNCNYITSDCGVCVVQGLVYTASPAPETDWLVWGWVKATHWLIKAHKWSAEKPLYVACNRDIATMTRCL